MSGGVFQRRNMHAVSQSMNMPAHSSWQSSLTRATPQDRSSSLDLYTTSAQAHPQRITLSSSTLIPRVPLATNSRDYLNFDYSTSTSPSAIHTGGSSTTQPTGGLIPSVTSPSALSSANFSISLPKYSPQPPLGFAKPNRDQKQQHTDSTLAPSSSTHNNSSSSNNNSQQLNSTLIKRSGRYSSHQQLSSQQQQQQSHQTSTLTNGSNQLNESGEATNNNPHKPLFSFQDYKYLDDQDQQQSQQFNNQPQQPQQNNSAIGQPNNKQYSSLIENDKNTYKSVKLRELLNLPEQNQRVSFDNQHNHSQLLQQQQSYRSNAISQQQQLALNQHSALSSSSVQSPLTGNMNDQHRRKSLNGPASTLAQQLPSSLTYSSGDLSKYYDIPSHNQESQQIFVLKSENIRLKSSFAQQSQQYVDLSSSYETLRQAHVDLQEQLTQQREQLSSLQVNYEANYVKLQDLRTRYEEDQQTWKGQIFERKAQVAALTSSNEQLALDLKSNEAYAATQIEQKQTEFRVKLLEVEDTIRIRDLEIKSLESQKNSLREEMEQKIQRESDIVRSLTSLLSSERNISDDLRSRISEDANALQQARKQIELLSNDLREEQQQHALILGQLEDQVAEKHAFKATIETSAKQQVDSMQATLTRSSEEFEKEIARIRENFEDQLNRSIKQEKAAFKIQIEQLSDELNEKQLSINSALEEAKQLRESIQEKESAHVNLMQSYSTKLVSVEEENAKLLASSQRTCELNEQLRRQNEEFTRELSGALSQLQEMEQTANKAANERKQVERRAVSDVQGLEQSLSLARVDTETISIKLHSVREQCEMLANENTLLAGQFKEIYDENQRLLELVNGYDAKNKSLEVDNMNLSERLRYFEFEENVELREKLTGVNVQNESLRQRIIVLEYSNEKQVRDALQGRCELDGEREKERMRIKAKYTAAKAALVGSEERVRSLEKSFSELEKTYDTLLAEFEKNKQTCEAQHSRIEEYTHREIAYQNEHAHLLMLQSLVMKQNQDIQSLQGIRENFDAALLHIQTIQAEADLQNAKFVEKAREGEALKVQIAQAQKFDRMVVDLREKLQHVIAENVRLNEILFMRCQTQWN